MADETDNSPPFPFLTLLRLLPRSFSKAVVAERNASRNWTLATVGSIRRGEPANPRRKDQALSSPCFDEVKKKGKHQ